MQGRRYAVAQGTLQAGIRVAPSDHVQRALELNRATGNALVHVFPGKAVWFA